MSNKKWQITLLLIAQFIIIACLEMTDPFWPLILKNHSQISDPAMLQYWSAAVYILPFLVTIITTPLWGNLGNKIGQKKMILRACLALVITQMLIGFVVSPILILAIRLIQGIFAGFTAASQAWAVTMCDADAQSRVIGSMQAATAVGCIVGPIIGGVIAHFAGYNAIFFISASLCALTALMLAFYLQETQKKQYLSHSSEGKILSNMSKPVLYWLSLIAMTQAAKWMSSSYFALYVIEQLHGNNLTVGILYSAIAVTVFFSAPRWGALIDKSYKSPRKIRKIFFTCLLFAGLSQYFYAHSDSWLLALMASLLLGIMLGAITVIPFSALIRQSENKGALVGLGSSATRLGNLMGVAAGTLIQAHSEFKVSFIAIGLVYMGIAIVLLLNHKPFLRYAPLVVN